MVGGSVKLVMATNRSLSLVETFHRPLVIGYLASDYAILADGRCAAPLSTFSVLEGRIPPSKPIQYQGCDETCQTIRSWRKQPGNKQKLEAWLQENGNQVAIADLETGDYAGLRKRVTAELIQPHN